MTINVDAGLSSLGRWSKWHIFTYCISCTACGFVGGWHMLYIVLGGLDPKYTCNLPEGKELNGSVPLKEGSKTDYEKCAIYANYSQESDVVLTECPLGINMDNSSFHSIVQEWDLTCERVVLVSTSQTVLVVGVLVGAMVNSLLADKFGRKPVFLSSVVGISLVGIITAFAPNYYTFVAFRFFTGYFQQGVILPGFIWICELFPASDRTIAGLWMQGFWAIGLFIEIGFAYATWHWGHYLLCISCCGLLVIPLFWLFSETVPWLVAHGRTPEAKLILMEAAKFNKKPLPKRFQLTEEDEAILKRESEQRKTQNLMQRMMSKCATRDPGGEKMLKKDEPEVQDAGLMAVVKSKRLLMFALIMTYIWCVNSLVYYGLSLSSGDLVGNPFLNSFLSSLVELPAYILAGIVLQLLGRRWPIFVFHLIAGIALFVTLFIPNEITIHGEPYSLHWLITLLVMVGKFAITGSFGSVFLYAPELFPTSVRNSALGIASVGGRLGNLCAPYTSYVMKILPWFPNVLFGVLCIVAGALTLLLPETLGRPLPLTVAEVENWTRTVSAEEKARYRKAKEDAARADLELSPLTANVDEENNAKA